MKATNQELRIGQHYCLYCGKLCKENEEVDISIDEGFEQWFHRKCADADYRLYEREVSKRGW